MPDRASKQVKLHYDTLDLLEKHRKHHRDTIDDLVRNALISLDKYNHNRHQKRDNKGRFTDK